MVSCLWYTHTIRLHRLVYYYEVNAHLSKRERGGTWFGLGGYNRFGWLRQLGLLHHCWRFTIGRDWDLNTRN